MRNKNRYEALILNRLLDQYENSRLSTGENQRTIHIEFPFRKKEIPEYFDESSGEYETIHILMQELEKKGWIRIFWKNGKVGHVIEKVRLELGDGETGRPELEEGETARLETENVNTDWYSAERNKHLPEMKNYGHAVLQEIYRYLGRKPLAVMEEETVQVLKQFLEETRRERSDCVQGKRASQRQRTDQGQGAGGAQNVDQVWNPVPDRRQEMTQGQDRNSTPSMRFTEYLLDRIRHHQPVKEYVDLTNPDSTKKFIRALRCVEENKDPCYIREFSIRYFQDSKYFEQIERQVAGVLRRFWPQEPDACGGVETPDTLLPTDSLSNSNSVLFTESLSNSYIRNSINCANPLEGMDTAEIMAEYGIYHTPNYVYLKGNVTISLKISAEGPEKGENGNSENSRLDLSLLHQGIGISGEDLPHLRFVSLCGIQKVLTIENLTTFFRWQEDDTLIIYLGGYHNGVRRSLLKSIYRQIPNVSYLHFGDLDAGGFSILEDLKRKTGIMFRPYHMDRETFEKYQNYAKTLTSSDRKRLELLARNPEYEDVIQCMLAAGKKLEQECVPCVGGGSCW